jgi:flagellar hook-associated protein 3 FlgL
MRISTAQLFQQRVSAILDQQLRLSRTEQQLATGKRILAASDDPAASLRNLQLGDRLAQTQQYQKNVDAATSRLALEEGILAGAVNLLQRSRELAVQANNATLSPADLKAIEVEIRENLDGLLDMANSQDANGEYLFSGYQGGAEAFTHDGAGNFSYNGDQGQRHLQVSATRQIAVGDHGARVFTGVPAAAGGVTSTFDILYDFAEALSAGAPDPATITDIDTAMTQLLDTRAGVGSRLRALDEQRNTNDSLSLLLEQDRSALTDLDYAEAISRFNRQLLAFQASEQVFSRIQGLSLFDYLG